MRKISFKVFNWWFSNLDIYRALGQYFSCINLWWPWLYFYTHAGLYIWSIYYHISLNLTKSHWISLNLIKSCQISPYLTNSHHISLNLTESHQMYQTSPYLTKSNWILSNLTISHWISPNITISNIILPIIAKYQISPYMYLIKSQSLTKNLIISQR